MCPSIELLSPHIFLLYVEYRDFAKGVHHGVCVDHFIILIVCFQVSMHCCTLANQCDRKLLKVRCSTSQDSQSLGARGNVFCLLNTNPRFTHLYRTETSLIQSHILQRLYLLHKSERQKYTTVLSLECIRLVFKFKFAI